MAGKYLLYIGTANIRRISVADWKQAGLDHPQVQWDAENKFIVPIEELNETALAILADDPELPVVDIQDENHLMEVVAHRTEIRKAALAEIT